MITVQETKSRQLSGPDEIAAYLAEQAVGVLADAPFRPGDAVDLTSRNGLLPNLAVGNVAIYLADVPHQPWSHILCLNEAGAAVPVQVQTANLTRRGVA